MWITLSIEWPVDQHKHLTTGRMWSR